MLRKTKSIRFFLLVAMSLGGIYILCAQNFPDPKWILTDGIRHNMDSLSAPVMQGREAGLKGGHRAAKFIMRQLQESSVPPLAGISDSSHGGGYDQTFQISGLFPRDISVNVTFKKDGREIRAVTGEDIFYYYNSPQSLDISGEAVFCGYGIEAPEYEYHDFEGIDISGKIVLAYYGEPLEKDSLIFFNGTHQTRYFLDLNKARTVAARGGKALILMPNPENETAFENFIKRRDVQKDRKNFVLRDETAVPVLYLSGDFAKRLVGEQWEKGFSAARQELRASLEKNEQKESRFWERKIIKPIKTRLKLTYPDPEIRECRNILAIIPGGDAILKNEYIIIGSHYDHEGVREGKLFPGADDNGSGVTANLAVAAAFARLPLEKRPARSLIFAFWDAEELGTLGSTFFTGHPPIPLSTIKVAINMDMIGRDASFKFSAMRQPMQDEDAENKVMIFYSAQSAGLRALADQANDNLRLHLLYDPNLFFTSGSDHMEFHAHYIPIVWYFTGFHTDYTSPGDTADKINYEKLTRISRHIASLAYLLAEQEKTPGFDTTVLTAPEGDFTR